MRFRSKVEIRQDIAEAIKVEIAREMRHRLRDVAGIAACEDIGPKRAERYGERILKVLEKARR